jgi:glyoxylase-like metal-dependent hydrolase (beta-lactamase superfamily II)
MHAPAKIDRVSADRAPAGVIRVRAPNPSPMTLDGTNTYVVGGWVVDPGPDDPVHLDRVADAVTAGVGDHALSETLAGIVLTHDHADHAAAAPALSARAGGVEVRRPGDGEEVGPFHAVATPGHARDHVCLLFGRILFTGDTVLGAGSVFIAPGEGSLSAYLDSLRRLRVLELEALCPGHGTRTRSSTSTSSTGSTASGGCSTPSPRGPGRARRCSTPPGRRCPTSCERPRPSL